MPTEPRNAGPEPAPAFARVVLDAAPFLAYEASQRTEHAWADTPRWPAHWIGAPAATEPFVALFRLEYHLPRAATLRVHVGAHERYELFHERAGRRELVGRGPTRAPAGFRLFETYEATLDAGTGILLARVAQLGRKAPWAQTGGACGFLLAVQDEALWDGFNTGRAPWRTRLLQGLAWRAPRELSGRDMGCGALEVATGEAIDPAAWAGGDWQAPCPGVPGNNGFTLYSRPDIPLLRPSPLPAPHSAPWRALELVGADDADADAPLARALSPQDEADWDAFRRGGVLTLPPQTRRRIWIRSGDYVCAYPTLRGRGGRGAVLRLGWAETLRDDGDRPLRRAPFEGAAWRGVWDEVRPDGRTSWSWTPTWWRCGLFLRLDIETADEPLELDALELRETRYPFESTPEAAAAIAAAPGLRDIFARCVRSLQACAHETYMDCPYYEQLQYLGDTRVQMLCSYAVFGDDRLARLALWTYAVASRNATGWMPSSAPALSGQRIATFTLWWIEMLHDFWAWRHDAAFVRELLPTARTVAELWVRQIGNDGLVALPPGWNYLDASGDLDNLRGPFHGAVQWHVAGVLRRLGELEADAGEPELAARAHRLARAVAEAGGRFWNADRDLMADDMDRTRHSEHTNLLALRSGLLDDGRRERIAAALFDREPPGLTPTTIYFAHYAFEVAAAQGRRAWMERRLAPWRNLAEQGLRTTPEHWSCARSECHAWGAHPLLHFQRVAHDG